MLCSWSPSISTSIDTQDSAVPRSTESASKISKYMKLVSLFRETEVGAYLDVLYFLVEGFFFFFKCSLYLKKLYLNEQTLTTLPEAAVMADKFLLTEIFSSSMTENSIREVLLLYVISCSWKSCTHFK